MGLGYFLGLRIACRITDYAWRLGKAGIMVILGWSILLEINQYDSRYPFPHSIQI